MAALAVLLGATILSQSHPQIFTQLGLKAMLTQTTIAIEFWPLYIWPAAFLIIFSAMLTGIPTVILFSLLFPFLGLFYSFAALLLCQIFTTFLALIFSIRKNNRIPLEKTLKPSLKNKLQELKLAHSSFAFWARVYYSFPLRSIDALTPVLTPDDQPLLTTIFPASAAILIRMSLPCLWAASLITLIKNISPDPAGDTTAFLLWSSALVAYTLIPRIPELFICPEKVKECLKEIEEMKPAAVKGFDEEIVIDTGKSNKTAAARTAKPAKMPASAPQPETGT